MKNVMGRMTYWMIAIFLFVIWVVAMIFGLIAEYVCDVIDRILTKAKWLRQ